MSLLDLALQNIKTINGAQKRLVVTIPSDIFHSRIHKIEKKRGREAEENDDDFLFRNQSIHICAYEFYGYPRSTVFF